MFPVKSQVFSQPALIVDNWHQDKVGRIVIDGVVDSEDYYAGKNHRNDARFRRLMLYLSAGLWSNNLRDADAVLFDVFQSCVLAGPEKCPMYEHNAWLISERLNKLLAKIKAEPLPYLWSGSFYRPIDYSTVKSMIFSSLYKTHGGSGKTLLSLLAALERGDEMSFSRYVDHLQV